MMDFYNLSIHTVMKLYRAKTKAIDKNDDQTIALLKEQYPELFSAEFDNFILNYKACVEILKEKQGQNLSEIFNYRNNSNIR